MKRRMEALNSAQHRAAEAMYRSANTAGAGAGGGAGAPGSGGEPTGATSGGASGDVIDAEVVEEERK